MAGRSFYQLHLSTCLILSLVAAAFMLVYSQTGEWLLFKSLFMKIHYSEWAWHRVRFMAAVLSFIALMLGTAIVCESRIQRGERE